MIENYMVWYERPNGERYSKEFTLDELIADKHKWYIASVDCMDNKIIEKHKGIGLKDINDKEIFTDSSIFEFEWDGVYIGYCYFDEDDFRYKIKILKRPIEIKNAMFITYDYDQYSMSNFKIVDTIQENKKGYINERYKI